ncbi:hypothetical protein B296_00050892 [Ensete ventricosum]|uniref:Uncharacterized protein n=1 Tax=Ensete ventricosum TaxID=4639 RepID=A0A426X291_ENSVE|nr:hypothetical protein B296_00050892 [Ensete ventricosum]
MLNFVLLLTGLQAGKPLFRKAKDGRILNWAVNADDSFCTLQEAFQGVDPGVGFNIELKFVDDVVYEDEELTRSLRATLRVRRTTAPHVSREGGIHVPGCISNVPEAVYMQRLMGVNGVIVDLVQEITEAVSEFISPDAEGDNKALSDAAEAKVKEASRPKFSQHELSFLLRLIPQLVQQQQ